MKKAVWEKKLINSYRLKIKALIKNEKDEYLLRSYYNDLAILDALVKPYKSPEPEGL